MKPTVPTTGRPRQFADVSTSGDEHQRTTGRPGDQAAHSDRREVAWRMAGTLSMAPSGWLTLERAIASMMILLFGVRITLGFGLTPGYLVAILLAPVWFSSLRNFWGARLLFAMGALALLSGVVLSRLAAATHVISQSEFTANVGLLLGLLSGIGVLLWARSLLPTSAIGVLFGMSMGITTLTGHGTLTSVDPLKFGWTVPVVIIVLSAVHQPGKLVRQLIAVLLMALLCAIADLRSVFGICLISAVLVAWQLRPKIITRRLSWIFTTLMMFGVAVGIYIAGTALLVDGFLGAAAQARSVVQIQTAGSLILGGRPELAATWALMGHQPLGFGIGVVPNALDLLTAKAGMARINYDPNNGYVERYMFGTKFELHSTAGDMWAYYGVVGLALALLITLVVVRSLALLISARIASAIVLLLGWWTIWNLMFSPMLTTVPPLMLAVALVLIPRGRARGRSDTRSEPTELERTSRQGDLVPAVSLGRR